MKLPKSMKATKTIIFTSMKMFFRDRQAVYWSLFLPLLIMVIFGVMKFDQAASVNLAIVDNAKNEQSKTLIDNLKKIETLKISEGTLEEEKKTLEDGELDMVVSIPKNFGVQNQNTSSLNSPIPTPQTVTPTKIEVLYNESKQNSNVQIGTTILNEVFDRYTHAVSKTPDLFVLEKKAVVTRNLKYIDFLIPGIVAMGIMQMSVFGVVGSIVNWRERGVLRRLLATPIHPSSIIFSQIVTRIIISFLQSAIIIAVGILFFGVHVVGSLPLVFLLTFLGGIIFLSFGFAVSGVGNSQNTVMALANAFLMPQMFLSGVFFPRDALPEILKWITQYLPLTYLADSIRKVMIDGSGLFQIQGDLLGLVVWIVIAFFGASKLFKWE